MIIGNETREIKAEIVSVNWNEPTQTGSVDCVYYYETTVEGVLKKNTVGQFTHIISANPLTSAKMTSLLSDAVAENPIP